MQKRKNTQFENDQNRQTNGLISGIWTRQHCDWCVWASSKCTHLFLCTKRRGFNK